ncbi:MAG: MBL fold metallo-hydrolase [Kofleriaceae bacterium]
MTDADRAAARQRSPAWDGRRFRNRLEDPPPARLVRTALRFAFERGEREPPRPLPTRAVDPRALVGGDREQARVTWLGHSTAWIELLGYTILIDPVWARRASPIGFAGPRRFQPVPLPLAELPRPDVIVISHDHYDHLDRDAVVALGARGDRFVVALGVGERLRGWGVPAAQIVELDWWQTVEPVPGLAVHALPARHFSGRTTRDRNTTLWAAWAFEAVRGTQRRQIHFGGDGGLDEDQLAEIVARRGENDLTMLECGGYDAAWSTIHLGPDGALRAHDILGGVLLPVHWGTFNLAFHAWDAPAEAILADAGDARPLALPTIGETITLGQALPRAPWWRVVRQEAEAPAPPALVAPTAADPP